MYRSPPPPPTFVFCMGMLQNKAQIARESIKNPEIFQGPGPRGRKGLPSGFALVIILRPPSENPGFAPRGGRGGTHVLW